ncbi:hypothetical protein PCIT_b1193 [Pseudoalteromonas citrea]|uniref:AraC family transcriptional regulator n=2 Tax=Pseudoalteromonas citrea TaxID=43655 RepID=A0AAD4AFK5_9GAMM|nr:AraC family transcriptional regulator [Pseudoalteromonas citrea]KAF7765057.1 hypothetical protein PCIT_b1193 [Pseudoalteromonas citrea]
MSVQLKITPNIIPWIGKSDALFKLKQDIEKLACSTIPIHITGKSGTGKSLAVQQIHQHSPHQRGKLVISCCKSWAPENSRVELDSLINQACHGTVYLKNIDALSSAQFEQIKDYWLLDNPLSNAVRLITSTSQCSTTEVGQVDTSLTWLQYYCLTLVLPSLSQRKGDVEPLISYYQKTDLRIGQLKLEKSAISLLTNYSWPDNVKQLKRCLEKLTFVDDNTEITKQALIEVFPCMAPNFEHHTQSNSDISAPLQSPLAEAHADLETELAVYFQTPNTTSLQVDKTTIRSQGHPALQRALDYLEAHYTQPLSLSEVAECACVSPSHLSFLFKRYIGRSFKQTLLRIRINTAMALFRENPYSQVTEVCDDVGFSDLSFFVRKFKAVVGVSPGVYRDQRAKH